MKSWWRWLRMLGGAVAVAAVAVMGVMPAAGQSIEQTTGTVTLTPMTARSLGQSVNRVRVVATSTSGGVAGGIITGMNGYLGRIETAPTSGSVPTAAWDVRAYTALGWDALVGNGVDQSSTTTLGAFIAAPDRLGSVYGPVLIDGPLRLDFRGLGSGKSVTVDLVWKPR